MTTFWVSKARYYCEYCKCWLADNKPSIDFHKQGERHKDAVRRRLRDARKKTAEEQMQKRETDELLRKINADALKAMNADVARNPALASRDSMYNQAYQRKAGIGPSSGVTASDMLDRVSKASTSAATTRAAGWSNYATPSGALPGSVPGSEPWVEMKSPEGHTYYHNSVTQESSWTKPTPSTEDRGASEAVQLENAWAEVSTDDGKTYYMNTKTGEKSWSKPESKNSEASHYQEEEIWAEVSTDDGKTYYLNTRTGETSWNKPERKDTEASVAKEDIWAEISTDDGKTYFLNTKTGEKSWSKPEPENTEATDKSNQDKPSTSKGDENGGSDTIVETDWAYTAEECAKLNEDTPKPEFVPPVASTETQDRSVPKHLANQPSTPIFKVKKPVQEGIVGSWTIITKSSEEDLQKQANFKSDDSKAEKTVKETSQTKSRGTGSQKKKKEESKFDLEEEGGAGGIRTFPSTIHEPGVHFGEPKVMPTIKRRGPNRDDDVQTVIKKKRRGNQNFKRRETSFS